MSKIFLIFRKLKRRIFSPPTRSERLFFNIVFSFFQIFSKNKLNNKKSHKKYKNIFIWDVRVNSITFDIVWVLFQAFIKFSNSNFDVLIYFPKGFKLEPFSYKNYNKYVSSQELEKRLNKLIVPIITNTQQVENIFHVDNEIDFYKIITNYSFISPRHFNPRFYSPIQNDMGTVYKYLLEKSQNKNLLKNFLEIKSIKYRGNDDFILDSPYVTLTLRDYGYSPLRNTTKEDVIKFLEFANMIDAQAVIVPDDFNNLKNYYINESIVKVCRDARIDMNKRIQLYSNSVVNIFSPCGPGQLSLFNGTSKTILFNYGVGGHDGDINYYKKEKLSRFDQPFLPLGGYIIWKEDGKEYFAIDLYKSLNNISDFENKAIIYK